MATVCPYCNIEVSESLIEAEDGCCPECGAVIGATSSFLAEREKEDGYDYEDEDGLSEFDDEDTDDAFARSEYEDDIFADDLDAELDEEFGDDDAFPEDEEDFDFDDEESPEAENEEKTAEEVKPAKAKAKKKGNR